MALASQLSGIIKLGDHICSFGGVYNHALFSGRVCRCLFLCQLLHILFKHLLASLNEVRITISCKILKDLVTGY